MSLFKNLFLKEEIYHLPDLKFGRFSDHHSSESKSPLWDDAIVYFDKKNYIRSYLSLLEYLENKDTSNINIIEKLTLRIRFEIIHGSKIISGYANQDGFFASTKIVLLKDCDESLFLKILEENYTLRYTKFGLDDEQHLILLFHVDHGNASPQFLYRGLRELAILGDIKDDLIVADYACAEVVNMEVKRIPSKQEVDLKYKLFQKIISATIEIYETEALPKAMHPGIYAYTFLAAMYKIDYLIKPEGKVLESVMDVHKTYYHSTLSIQEKLELMYKQVTRLVGLDEQRFEQELYDTISTFGILQPCNSEKAKDFLLSEIQQADWYLNNGHPGAAKSICDYAVGYLLYSYELPLFLKEFLHLYYEITENSYFSKLGLNYKEKSGEELKKKQIIKKIAEVKAKLSVSDKSFTNNGALLYNNVTSFSHSFLREITKINL